MEQLIHESLTHYKAFGCGIAVGLVLSKFMGGSRISRGSGGLLMPILMIGLSYYLYVNYYPKTKINSGFNNAKSIFYQVKRSFRTILR